MIQVAIAPPETTPLHTKRKIAVLHLIHSVCYGGIESVLLNWVRYMDPSRVDVYVACLAGDRGREKAFVDAAARYGIQVLPVRWTKYKPFLGASRSVAALIAKHNIDVLHTHAYYADVIGAMTKMWSRVKTVSTVYVWGKYEFHRQLMQAIDWTALHFVDKVTAHCQDTFDKTIKLGFDPREVVKLIAGFPADEISPPCAAERRELRRSLGIGDDEVLLLNVARLHPEKAHDQLLKSFKLVHDKHPNTRLWISGIGWEELKNELLKLRAELGLTDSVEFIGFHHDLRPYLFAADLMTHPSHVEGVPIAILLGMSAGLPIVISDVGSVHEVIQPGRTGLLVKENDVDGFAQQVISLVNDPKTARRIGDAAREFVSTEYSIHTAVGHVTSTYDQVLGL
jgi:glycosyltransferase involved in cell wall biosynthesis